MQPVKSMVRITHGSHLYGTNTPASDTDLKGIHLPAGEDIILMRQEANHMDRSIKVSDTVKNQAGDTDDQSYSLQKWLYMLTSGDTVAFELLFAPEHAIVEQSHLWPSLRAQAVSCINRRVEGFVSYCQRQAAKYGIKGSRMGTVEKLVELLDREIAERKPEARLEDIEDVLRTFCDDNEHAEIAMIVVKGVEVPHLRVCDRAFTFRVKMTEAVKVYRSVYKQYGARAIAAKSNDGIDWKAISHAVRVAQQAIELLETGSITFPRPNADYLLAIKQGEISFDEVQPVLEGLVEDLRKACERSDLPEETDQALIDDIVLTFHRLQVVDPL